MEPIELTARREALGFTGAALAKHFQIRENNLARWEGGTYAPRDWGWIDDALTTLEATQQKLKAQMLEQLRAAEENGELEDPTLVTYADEEVLVEVTRPTAEGTETIEVTVPGRVHRTAAAAAAVEAREQLGLTITLISAPTDSQD